MERYTCGAEGLVLQYIRFLQSVIYRFNKFHSKSIQFVWKLSGPRIANSFQMKNKLYISWSQDLSWSYNNQDIVALVSNKWLKWNRVQKYNCMYMDNWFLTKVQRQFNGDVMIFWISGIGIIWHPHAIIINFYLYLTSSGNLSQNRP